MDNIIIEKVINNNIISAYEKSGAEVIVMGRGIGFKKKQGEMVPADQISKIFRIKSRTLAEQFKELLANMPLERVRISDEIISHAKDHLKLKLNQSIYVTLTDHINSAVARYREGIALKNMMKIDIRKFYPKEYQVGMHAIEWIKEQTGEDLGDDEAAFIAMHIVSAELNAQNITDVNQITELINTVLQIVRIHFKIDLNEESISYERFLTHLKFFAARVFDHMEYKDTMQEIYKVMVEQNENAFSGVKKIAEYIKKQYNYKLTIDEQLYLLIHIKRILDEQTK